VRFYAAVSLRRVPEPRRLADIPDFDPSPDFNDIFISKYKIKYLLDLTYKLIMFKKLFSCLNDNSIKD
jgi:hypothetical protein